MSYESTDSMDSKAFSRIGSKDSLKFKEGDRVRVMKKGTHTGKLGVVTDPCWHDRLVKVELDSGKGEVKTYMPSELEAVAILKFQEGDRIIVTKEGSHTGHSGCVLDPCFNHNYVKVELADGGIKTYLPSELEGLKARGDCEEGSPAADTDDHPMDQPLLDFETRSPKFASQDSVSGGAAPIKSKPEHVERTERRSMSHAADQVVEARERAGNGASSSPSSLPNFFGSRRGAQFVEGSGRRRPDEVELSVIPDITEMSKTKVDDQPLGECVQRAIEELGLNNNSAYIMFEGKMTKVEQLRPDVFQAVRRIGGVADRYLSELCHAPYEAPPEWCQRRPAFATSSGRFVLEVVQASQVHFFASIADRYLTHLEKHPDSLLCHIVGIYDIAMKTFPSGCVHVVVMNNFLPTQGARKLDYLYNLVGVEKERFVQRTGVAAQMLQDANFVQEQQVVMFAKERKACFMQSLETDTKFLHSIRSSGYSLMLGIRKTPEGAAAEQALRSEQHKRHHGQRARSVHEEDFTLSFCAQETSSSSSRSHGRDGVSSEGAHSQLGWRPNARGNAAEQVVYYFGLVDVLEPWSWFSKKGLWYLCRCGFMRNLAGRQHLPPGAYQRRFFGFVEDRVLPFSCADDFDKFELPGRRNTGRLACVVDGLSMVAGGDEDDLKRTRSPAELARWLALIDALEAGSTSFRSWVDLGLVEASELGSIGAFRLDLSKRKLPPNSGDKHIPSGVALLKIGKLVNSVAKANSLKGKLLSNSSTQYSLALAIAVGVEAATKCSAKIATRCAKLFEQSPELIHRPAAALSKRSFHLPEEGSWLSPPHMLPDLQFVEHAPEVFRRIRFSAGINDQAYITCVCQREFSFIEFTTNSKSGEFFFFSHDGRCMVKTISSGEAEALIRLLQGGYADHLSDPAGSLLTRIFGLYQVRLPWFSGGKAIHFMVQENVLLTTNKLQERFDLKGSTHGREARIGESVQKDNDWTSRGLHFDFPDALRETIQKQHSRDCEFLASMGCIDYSVLVGFCDSDEPTADSTGSSVVKKWMAAGSKKKDEGVSAGVAKFQEREGLDSVGPAPMILPKRKPGELWTKLRQEIRQIGPHGPHEGGGRIYFFGIIDFLVTWSCKKRAEYLIKCLQCKAMQASVCPPHAYAQRQIEYMEKIL